MAPKIRIYILCGNHNILKIKCNIEDLHTVKCLCKYYVAIEHVFTANEILILLKNKYNNNNVLRLYSTFLSFSM